jgi:hypothetical protein
VTIRFLGRRGAPLPLDEVVARLHEAGLDPVVDGGVPIVAWVDGPAVATVAARVGDVTGWQWGRDIGENVGENIAENIIVARRSFSVRSVATALVRFYGSEGRHYSSEDERRRPIFDALLEIDDPARSGYPIVDAVVELLLAQPDLPTEPDVDALSAALRAARYERLWEQAYVAVS